MESDFKVLVDIVKGNFKFIEATPVLIRRICDLINIHLQVQINRTWQDNNKSADLLVAFSLTQDSFSSIILEALSRELKRILFEDIF